MAGPLTLEAQPNYGQSTLTLSKSDSTKAPDAEPAPAPVKTVTKQSAAFKAAHALADLMESVHGAGGKDAELGLKVEALTKRVDQIANQAPAIVKFEISGHVGKPVSGAHPILSDIVQSVAAGLWNIWLAGPAGSGKSTLGEHLATALGLEFGAQSFAADSTAAHLIGGPNAQGVYQETAFIDAYENGKVYLLDELDAAPAEILVAVNSALANGHLHLPRHHDQTRRTIKRHAKTVIVAAANTWGTGPSAQYVGRSAIDAATLDRFAGAKFFVGYDIKREAAYLKDRKPLADRLFVIRKKLEDHKIRRMISTRSFIAAAKLATTTMTDSAIVDRMICDWTSEEKAKVQA